MQIRGGINEDEFVRGIQSDNSQSSILLRDYIDEWLRTGFNGEREEPAQRSLSGAPVAQRALHRYLSEFPPIPIMTNTGFYAFFGIGHLRNTERAIENQAAFLFASLIDSPWRDRLFKCRRCGDYGLLKKKARDFYKRGIHCEKCKSRATATASTAAIRKDRDTNRLKATTVAWRAWRPTCRLPRKEWVVQRANQHLNVDDRITKKWVTRNQSKIEAAAAEG